MVAVRLSKDTEQELDQAKDAQRRMRGSKPLKLLRKDLGLDR